ncbi:OLC1v1024793C1 [Oldenlandia corymbosa var. corymbosa]|uniref:Potassium transporter n=1 Tax=Oldenlandia corymbosa var. corymbosa TaxID=529605 RepID=A0AAV1C5L6_OLDCO|nr:OLC1v1024793C1 [Oldenlandia corymbosa var. corymbosa]
MESSDQFPAAEGAAAVDHRGGDGAPSVATTGNLNDRKLSWAKLHRVDSLNLEAGNVLFSHANHRSTEGSFGWKTTLSLAFQSIGVIYGDIGTSPLYVYSSTFTKGITHTDDVLGVLSLILYTLILVPMIKYVFIVLWANDNGDGGTFALYSLLCRYAKVSLIPNHQPEDKDVSNYRLEVPSNHLRRSQKIKEKLEKSNIAKIVLFLCSILGTSMVIGDGVLTPCISVLSAVGGIPSLSKDAIAGISIAILVCLFRIQRFGTDKVGFAFAPVITLWFLFISLTGLYNLFKYEPGVFRALNPVYIVDYFRRNGKDGWISLGGVVLCITGTEAMFADLGHFNVRAIQISFSAMVFPALSAAYAGQASYLMKFPNNVHNAFYDSIPDPIYWPTFVIAVAAAIIASQAMISGAFAIISQSLSLNCFPRVRVVHTSAKYDGQVYIPEINFLLMVACVVVTWGFKTTESIGNAYGIAVVAVMVITTCLVTLIMLMIWKASIWWISLFFLVYMSVDLIYLSAVLYKFKQGGYLPLGLALVLMIIMGIWHYAHKERYLFELHNKVSNEYVRDLAKNPRIKRVPGIGLLYSELVQGIPPIFPHFISNISSVHSVVVMVSIKSIPISKVSVEERFLFRQVEPKDFRVFRCVVRYGYKDKIEEPRVFEHQLIENLKDFIRHENFILEDGQTEQNMQHFSGLLQGDGKADERIKSSSSRVRNEESSPQQELTEARVSSSGSIQPCVNGSKSRNSSVRTPGGATTLLVENELQIVQRAMDQGVFYLLGEAEVVARQDSSLLKKFVVNYAYSFLRKNGRQGEKTLEIPRTRLLRVGMVYEI